MNHRFILKLFIYSVLLLFITSCTKVTRINPDTTIDYSGKWNDVDSRLVAEEMIKDCLSKPWLTKYSNQNLTPKIIIGRIRNRSHEHISTEIFTKDIERVLINSGKVEFVATKEERQDLRDERQDQQEWSSEQTRKELRNETGAEIMLYGSINSVTDLKSNNLRQIMYYQIDLELVNIETNQKLWIGSKEIKKYIKRPKATL